ncbi:MAG: 4-alpha-glucanotransferase, partial [Paludibacteraceae bacterium]|nr:4-alpha-glucanotransferase [Paludibacteraceae bacterium]
MLQITFVLRYKSYFGEDLHIKGDIPELGKDNELGLPLHYTDNGWMLTIETSAKSFHYSYMLTNQQGQLRKEKPFFRKFDLPNRKYKTIVVYDMFEDGDSAPTPLLSKAFTESIMRHESKEIALKGRKVPMSFNVVWPNLPTSQQIAILGNSSELGNWNQEEASTLNCTTFPEFCTVVDANNLFFPIEYKYVIKNNGTTRIEKWEDGANHYISYPPVNADFIVVNDGRPRFPIGDFKGAGTAVPVFSLRSRNSFGVGEFTDLKLLADWAQATGQRIIQTLPINDTTNLHTWKDSYPYSGISVFALHPMYLNLEEVGEIPDLKKYNKLRD